MKLTHEILSWAFGFFTPFAVAGAVAAAIFCLIGWFSLPNKFQWLSIEQAWAGGWLLAGIAIFSGVVIWRVRN